MTLDFAALDALRNRHTAWRLLSEGGEADLAKRIAELHKKRDDIDAEIAHVGARPA